MRVKHVVSTVVAIAWCVFVYHAWVVCWGITMGARGEGARLFGASGCAVMIVVSVFAVSILVEVNRND